jgi:hypothetical protein
MSMYGKSRKEGMTSERFLPFLAAIGLLLYGAAPSAHVKWFVEVDVSDPPRDLALVLSPMFWGLLALASAALFVVFLIDIHWSRRGRLEVIEQLFSTNPDVATYMVRIGTGVFFVAVWLVGDVILTPELVTDSPYVGAIQLFTAFFTLFVPTLILSAAGILALYVFGVMEYGIYHMIDYVVFLGVAAYLAISSLGNERLLRHRLPLLISLMLFSFLWSAIEKLGYPQWFDPFLDENEFLTIGLPRDFFVMSAAFVEFTLCYVLLAGRNLVILGSIALNFLIIAGALYFGKVDALGHFLIIVILAIMTIKGPNSYSIVPYRDDRPAALQSMLMLMGYWVVLGLLFALYYGLHRAVYGW